MINCKVNSYTSMLACSFTIKTNGEWSFVNGIKRYGVKFNFLNFKR